MKRFTIMTSCTVVLALVTGALVGCETYGEGAGLGGLLGAGAGAIIGNQSGHAVEGALIGAGVGALAGLIAHDIKAKKQRDAAAAAAAHNYQPTQGLQIISEDQSVAPTRVTPGNEIETTFTYSVLGSGGGVQVTETRILLQGDRVVNRFNAATFNRDDGTWYSTQSFRLPNNMAPGQYSVVTEVRAANLSIQSTPMPFSVS